MTSFERVARTIRGETTDRTPVYGWVSANLDREISEKYGSVAAFEDHYEFDMAHIFGGPSSFDNEAYQKIRESGEELTPDIALSYPLLSPDHEDAYEDIRRAIAQHKERDRFCYVQTPGFFEHFNGLFGIENQLCYLLLYEDEIDELYRRQAEWTCAFADHCIDCGADMIHISDDWGAQKGLMFSPDFWYRHIFPNLKKVVDHVHRRGKFVSLHSDGCIVPVVDGVVEAGLDLLHPWQETAGMSYDLYLDRYADRFALLGGICIQSTLGFGDYARLEREIRRVFSLLRGKRWICCTTHFVQNHCTMDELDFAFDLIYRLARGEE